MASRKRGPRVEAPVRPFLWTIDQVADMLEISVRSLKANNLHFDGISFGPRPKDRMMTRNVAPDDLRESNPEWRVSHAELTRWMTNRGFQFTQRNYY